MNGASFAPAADPGTAGRLPANPWAARWEARWRDHPGLFGDAPNAFLAGEAARLRPGMRALCPGEGEGRNALFLARHGLAVTAVDFSPAALARLAARARAENLPIETLCADLSRWSWPQASFDLVALIFVQLSPDERVAVHRGAASALAPGGVLLFEGFGRGQARSCGPRGDESRYDAAMLRADFAGLDIIALAELTVVLAEGEGHRGEASVVRMVAHAPGRAP